jgi:hypothetical protein
LASYEGHCAIATRALGVGRARFSAGLASHNPAVAPAAPRNFLRDTQVFIIAYSFNLGLPTCLGTIALHLVRTKACNRFPNPFLPLLALYAQSSSVVFAKMVYS